MKITPDCLCNRGKLCGLVTGKLDDLDYERMWLPAGFSNRISGSLFSQSRKEKIEIEYADRREAVKDYLAKVRRNNKSY